MKLQDENGSTFGSPELQREAQKQDEKEQSHASMLTANTCLAALC